MNARVQSQDIEHTSDDRAPLRGEVAGAGAPVTADGLRHQRIAEAAYRRAERRGFVPGAEVEDWLDAELEIDADRSRASL